MKRSARCKPLHATWSTIDPDEISDSAQCAPPLGLLEDDDEVPLSPDEALALLELELDRAQRTQYDSPSRSARARLARVIRAAAETVEIILPPSDEADLLDVAAFR